MITLNLVEDNIHHTLLSILSNSFNILKALIRSLFQCHWKFHQPTGQPERADGGGGSVVRPVGDSRRVGVEHNYPVIEEWAQVIGDLLMVVMPNLQTTSRSLSIRSGSCCCGHQWVYCLSSHSCCWSTQGDQRRRHHIAAPGGRCWSTVSWPADIMTVHLCRRESTNGSSSALLLCTENALEFVTVLVAILSLHSGLSRLLIVHYGSIPRSIIAVQLSRQLVVNCFSRLLFRLRWYSIHCFWWGPDVRVSWWGPDVRRTGHLQTGLGRDRAVRRRRDDRNILQRQPR